MIIDYFYYNGNSMLHPNHIAHLQTPKTPAKFQEDPAKIVEVAFTRYPVSISFGRSPAKK